LVSFLWISAEIPLETSPRALDDDVMWSLRDDMAQYCVKVWTIIGWIKHCIWVNDVMVKCEVSEWSVLVRVECPFLVLQIGSHRMRTKPRAHVVIAYSCVILVSFVC